MYRYTHALMFYVTWTVYNRYVQQLKEHTNDIIVILTSGNEQKQSSCQGSLCEYRYIKQED